MNMLDMDLNSIRRLIDTPICQPEEGDYAELVNENDEQGLVRVCSKNGSVVMVIPRDVWDRLVEAKT